MSKYKYQEIIDEFDSYMDNNYPETIYIDTINLYANRETDIYSIYEEIVELKQPIFEDILNRKENFELCKYIERNRKKKVFYEQSHRILEVCYSKNDLNYKLSTIQVISTNAQLKNKHLISEIRKEIDNYSIPSLISLKNASIKLDNEPYERLLEFIDLINRDKKNENFYSSYIEFYFSNFRAVIELILDSIKSNTSNYTAILLPVIYLAVKKELFPPGTKTTLDSLKSALKKTSRKFPSELDIKYHLVSEILNMDTNKYKKKAYSSKTKKAEQGTQQGRS